MNRNEPLILLVTAAILLALSGIAPLDRATWWMETATETAVAA